MTPSSPEGPRAKALPEEAAAILLLESSMEFQALRDAENPDEPVNDGYFEAQARHQVRRLIESGWSAPGEQSELERLTAEVERLRSLWPLNGLGEDTDVKQLIANHRAWTKSATERAEVLSGLLRGMARRATLRKRQARLMATTSERFFNANRNKAAQIERLQAEYDQAIEEWGRNDEQVLAENQRLADEQDSLRAQLDKATDLSRRLLMMFTTGEKGHPGRPCVRTGWIDESAVAELHEELSALTLDELSSQGGDYLDATLFAVAVDRVRRDKGDRHTLEDVARELDFADDLPDEAPQLAALADRPRRYIRTERQVVPDPLVPAPGFEVRRHPRAPRVWRKGDPEPGEDVQAVRHTNSQVFTRRPWPVAYGKRRATTVWQAGPASAWLSWEQLTDRLGDYELTEMAPPSLPTQEEGTDE